MSPHHPEVFGAQRPRDKLLMVATSISGTLQKPPKTCFDSPRKKPSNAMVSTMATHFMGETLAFDSPVHTQGPPKASKWWDFWMSQSGRLGGLELKLCTYSRSSMIYIYIYIYMHNYIYIYVLKGHRFSGKWFGLLAQISSPRNGLQRLLPPRPSYSSR